MNLTEQRFRIRSGDKVVGYMRKPSPDASIFYSRDSFWWSGRKIEYDEIDEWVGLKDKNGRLIYEWDILYYKLDPDAPNSRGVILWEANKEIFGIRDIEQNVFIPLQVSGVDMFNPREMQVFSYLFLNPELKKELGIEE